MAISDSGGAAIVAALANGKVGLFQDGKLLIEEGDHFGNSLVGEIEPEIGLTNVGRLVFSAALDGKQSVLMVPEPATNVLALSFCVFVVIPAYRLDLPPIRLAPSMHGRHMYPRQTRHQVPRTALPDATFGSKLYLLKKVSTLRLTYQIRLLAHQASQEFTKLVIQVPKECRLSGQLRKTAKASGGQIKIEKV